MRLLGIDFGTSNTVAMLRMPDGRTRPLLFDGSPLLPSAIYLAPDGRMLIGRDAERNARVDPSRFEPNPKRRIDDGTVLLGDQELPVPRAIAYVLEQVATETKRQLGGPPQQLRMTHPARWGEQRRNLLVEAARLAGLPRPQLIAEPVGAASYFTAVLGTSVPAGRALAIYDLGGGTFDATVVRRTQSGFDVLAEEGIAEIGGLDFDHAIVEHLGRTYSGSHAELWDRLAQPQDANDRRYRRMLYEDVRGAKEMLSRTSSADIHLPALEVDAHLTREELETLIRPQLEQTVTCLQRAISESRMAAKDLVGIFLVGGSSRIPLAAQIIHSELGVAPTTLEQPETVVVEGALCIGAPARPAAVSGVPRPAGPPPQLARPPQARPPQAPPQQVPPPQARPAQRPVAGPLPPRMLPPRPGAPVPPRPPGSPMGPTRPPAPPVPVGRGPAPGAGPVSGVISAPPASSPPMSGPPSSGPPSSGPPMSGPPSSGPPSSGPPMSGPPMSPPPQQRPPMPPARPAAQVPPQRMAPPAARPAVPPRPPVAQPQRPVQAPMPARSQVPTPRPMAAPLPAPVEEKRWHQEPAVVLTLGVAVLLLIGFGILLAIALASS